MFFRCAKGHHSQKNTPVNFLVLESPPRFAEGGINNVLDALDLPDLYDIFEVEDSHEFYQKIDWENAKELVTRLLDAFRPIAKNYFVVDTMRFMLKKDIISPRR